MLYATLRARRNWEFFGFRGEIEYLKTVHGMNKRGNLDSVPCGSSKAQIYCTGPTHSSPRLIFTVIAVWDPIFCRFRLDLRMMNVAIDVRSRERGRCYPLRQRDQDLEEWLAVMWKSCWKKCFNVMNPSIPLYNWILWQNSWKRIC